MRSFRRLAHLAIATGLVLSATPASAAERLSDLEVAEAVRFRAEFGFDTARAHIESTSASADAHIDYGTALTPDEAAEMARRIEIEERLAPLGEFLAKLPNFGGAYIDQPAGHVLVIGFVGDPAPQHLAGVEALLPPGARFEVREVDRTEAQLREIQTRVDQDREWLRKELGIELIENPVDPRTNVVGLGVSRVSSAIEAALRDRYGQGVSVYSAVPGEFTACTSRNSCTDGTLLRGGTQLYDQGCSNAFFVYQGSSYYTVTAGHWPCGLSTHTYQHPNNVNLGAAVNSWFATGASADSAVVSIPSVKASRRVYITAGSYYPMLYVQQRGTGEMVGMSVCLSGRQRGEGASCGTVYAINFSFTACDTRGVCATLANQRSGTYAIVGGDSGGAIFGGNTAFGVQSSINASGRGIYGHITYVLSHFGVTLCTTCP